MSLDVMIPRKAWEALDEDVQKRLAYDHGVSAVRRGRGLSYQLDGMRPEDARDLRELFEKLAEVHPNSYHRAACKAAVTYMKSVMRGLSL